MMRVAVTGSIANDYLMTFPGRFADQIMAEQLDRLSLSFLVDDLEIRRGGAAANISFGLARLGVQPLLIGAVGHDFRDDYESWLSRHGVDLTGVHYSVDKHTARFLCTTDQAESQIASFYAGAMADARDIELAPVARRAGGIDLVIISPDDPVAMLRHTETGLEMDIEVVADPSQQLARMDGEPIRRLLDGVSYVVANDYERSLYEAKTGWSATEVLRRVRTRVTTHGPKGATVERGGAPAVEVGSVSPRQGATIEPTGAGDAFRAGFFAGVAHGLPAERSAQLGCLVATLALESVGSQEYRVDRADAAERLAAAYGDHAADEIMACLPADVGTRG
jgi:adenosine kinase